MIISNEAAATIAMIAALISAFSLGWNIYRDIINTGRLKVTLMVGNQIPDLEGFGHYLFVEVTNIGTRPVLVTNIGGEYKTDRKHDFVLNFPQIPKMLQEGERLTEKTPYLGDLEDISKIYAYDPKGKRYRASNKDIRRALTNIAKVKVEEGTLLSAKHISKELEG